MCVCVCVCVCVCCVVVVVVFNEVPSEAILVTSYDLTEKHLTALYFVKWNFNCCVCSISPIELPKSKPHDTLDDAILSSCG